jgi:membrane-associated protease RseP (regulator of RpoE activity)
VTLTNLAPESTSLPEAPEQVEGDEQSRSGLMLLILSVGLGIYAGIVTESLPVVLFVLGIIVMVMVHEAGHFVAAKKCGMKVTQFFFGFGPRLWSVRRGETEYGFRALPLGGFVKIVGMSNVEEVDPADEARTYRQQSYPKRVVVALAGPATHFVIAFLVFVVIFFGFGVNKATLRIDSISRDSAAEQAGFRVGDEIVAIDGQPISRWEDLPPYVQGRANQPLAFTVQRGGEELTLTARPGEVDRDGRRVGFLGVGPVVDTESESLPAAIASAGEETASMTVLAVKSMSKLVAVGDFVDRVRTEPEVNENSEPVVGMVGAARLTDQAAEQDIRAALLLFAGLNIFVALVNLLPLPPFDGGHVAVATYERIRSRKGKRYHADVSKIMPVAVCVVAYMVIVGALTLFGDIFNPVQLPK